MFKVGGGILVLACTTVLVANAFALPPAFAQGSGGGGMKPLFEDQGKPLFSDPLFSDDNMASKLDMDVNPQPPPSQRERPTGAAQVQNQIQTEQIDQQMRQQMTSVANWLERYCILNGSRFPGFVDDNMYAAQVQLSELVPNNPYAYGYTQALGQHGIAYQYNQNGSPATGSVVWGDSYTEHLQAQQNNRIVLNIDYSLTPVQINEWVKNPPQEWTAAPGTITCTGNNQGLFIVWGAGKDGKPIKSLYNGGTDIIVGSSSGTVNDSIAPNEY